MANSQTGAGLAEVVSSALGAAIAVFGAVWVSDHHANRERDELRAILAGGLHNLRKETQEALNRFDEEEKPLPLHEVIAPVVGRWLYLAEFRPYRQLGDVRLIGAMSSLDTAYAQLQPYANEEANRPPPNAGSLYVVFLDDRRRAARAVLLRAGQTCVAAERTFA